MLDWSSRFRTQFGGINILIPPSANPYEPGVATGHLDRNMRGFIQFIYFNTMALSAS
jgi:hypothetical protein